MSVKIAAIVTHMRDAASEGDVRWETVQWWADELERASPPPDKPPLSDVTSWQEDNEPTIPFVPHAPPDEPPQIHCAVGCLFTDDTYSDDRVAHADDCPKQRAEAHPRVVVTARCRSCGDYTDDIEIEYPATAEAHPREDDGRSDALDTDLPSGRDGISAKTAAEKAPCE